MSPIEAPSTYTAELQCADPECGHIWDSPATRHMGALDVHDEHCPECGESDPEVLEVS
jgi:predicted RNA-binding Zn-ribbon protein involved in translation (DUF1610 family)